MKMMNLFTGDCNKVDYFTYSVGKREHAVQEGAIFLDRVKKLLDAEGGVHAENFSGEEEWWFLYHFSDLRRGILNWYPFAKDSSLLEIGGECGALTGLFCEKCDKVVTIEENVQKAEIIRKRYEKEKNLDVVCKKYSSLENLHVNHKFDYVVINRVFEYIHGMNPIKFGEFLKSIAALFLVPNGKLLIIADNRYAIRNFCGARDILTGKPFDALNQYPEGIRGTIFSRQQLVEGIEGSKKFYYKFYYPLPDYRMTQLIFSDEYMNKADIRDRIISYEPFQDTLLAVESNLYEDILVNGALPFLSNSFLIECCQEKDLCEIEYATSSEDRGKIYGTATTIWKDGFVRKKALYKEGYDSIINSFENLKKISVRGLRTSECYLEPDGLVMPYINKKSFAIYLAELAQYSKDEFLEKLSLWYMDILKSSDYVKFDGDNPETKKFHLSEEDKILRYAYIDMVPVNCFWDEEGLIYFDQEFSIEFVPAKYVLFRGIKYLYQSHKKIQQFVPIEEVKEYFDICEMWDIFDEIEKEFIDKIRNRKRFSLFYKYTKFNRKEIYQRADILEYQGEKISGIRILENTKLQQHVQLELLDRFMKVCKEHGLRFFMFYGSLLGTVRHQGYIPWDDDMDIVMPRKDYDRLIEISESCFSYPYFLQTPENDREVFYGGYAKLRNSATTAMEPRNWRHSCNQGIWIDIFPLDNCSSNKDKNKELWEKIHFNQKMLFACVYEKALWEEEKENWEELRKEASKQTHADWCNQLSKLLHAYDDKSPYLTIYARYMNREPLSFFKEDFSDSILMNFEGLQVPVPIGYNRCLEIINGKRYMVYPKPEYRNPRHRGLFSADIPYSRYTDRFKDVIGFSKVILIGESEVIDFYCKKFKRFLERIVLVPEAIDGQCQTSEIIRISKGDILLYQQDFELIICAKRFLKYEKILSEWEIDEYKIYISNGQYLVQNM